MVKVVVAEGLDEREAFSLTKSLVTLGRSAHCDIVLPNPAVSRKHAEIVEEGGHYYLDDLGSRNGTQLNGARVKKRSLLSDGDVIQVDDIVLRFCVSEEESSNSTEWAVDSSQPDQTDHIVATLDVDADLRLAENAEHKLRAITELSRNIGVSLDIEAVMPRVLDSLLEIFPKADRVTIVLTDGNHQLIPYAIKSRDADDLESATIAPISRTIVRRVLSEQIAILSSDVLTDNRFKESASALELGIRSMICAPLIGPSKQPVGALMVDVQELEQPFDEGELDVLVTVSRMVAQNMDYMRLHEQFIEERKHAEATLRQSNETLKTLINSSPLALFLLNGAGHVSRVWNPAATALFGWTPLQVFEQGLKVIAPEDREKFQQLWKDVVNGHSLTGVEIGCRTKSGEEIDIEFSAAPLRNPGGDISEVIFIAADVTELKKTREQMLQNERLAAIGETMAALTHESRNALNRIQLGAELLKSSPSGGGVDVPQVAREIANACDDLKYLYEDVRHYGAPIRLEKRDCQLTELVSRTWESLTKVRNDREATLKIHRQIDDSNCCLDVVRFEQVFRNLFENALDVSEGPVQIDVTLAPAEEPDAIRVSVCDDGPGLTPDQRRHLFEPFYTTKSSGTGLGMAIVKRVVEAHGGTILVGESEARGAEFVIEIPKDVAATEEFPASRGPTQKVEHERLHHPPTM